MSLLGQTARYLLLVASSIALIGSIGFYTLIHSKIQLDVDEMLLDEFKKTEQRLQHQPASTFVDWDDNPHIEPVRQPVTPTFSDAKIRNDLNQLIDVRQYQATVSAQGQLYLVRYQLPYLEFNELASHLSLGVIIGFLALTGLSVAVGIGLARRLWQPFYMTLKQLDEFKLDQPLQSSFPTSHIREFNLLSQSLDELTTKAQQQYLLQKQFTENASHELQTPLAIATIELDSLLQSNHLTQADYTHLQQATDAISRLNQLNRSLLLLTHVENNEYIPNETFNLSALLKRYAADFEPFFLHKQFSTKLQITPNVWVSMNRNLAEVLLANLLKNTIRHGSVDGSVRIALAETTLLISNTGKPLPFADDQLFNRFTKDPNRSDSVGLGLALVKQICDRYDLPLTYNFDRDKNEHSFRIDLRRVAQA